MAADAGREIVIEPEATSGLSGWAVSYTGGTADLDDLGSDRPITFQTFEGATRHTLEVPIAADAIAEGEETFTVTVTFTTLLRIQATSTINASDGAAPPPAVDNLAIDFNAQSS